MAEVDSTVRTAGKSEENLDSYDISDGTGCSERRIQRSRFLATAAPAASETDARAVVADLAKRYHDSRHVCWAWRGGQGEDLRELRNDAGEPAGSAGEPILTAIRKADLTDTVAVVVRYFGGVKLGTGGLARAYGETAAEALAAVSRRTIYLGREWDIHFPYSLQKTVLHFLDQYGGHTVKETYTETVKWHIWLPISTWRICAEKLLEATSGKIDLLSDDTAP